MNAQFSMNWHCNMAEGLEEDDDPLYLIGDDEMCIAFAEVTGEDWESCAARARLMTAAPKLLVACRQLISQLRPVANDDHEWAAIQDGEAAIAAAEYTP